MENERVRGGPSRPSSKKPCRFFHQNDCYRGDKCHMVHAPKDQLAPCEIHQFWMEDPWTRPPCEWKESCSRTHLPHTGPGDPELRRTNIALQTENSQLSRVRVYAAEVLGSGGKASVTGVARSGTSRYRQKLVLLAAKDPEELSRACIADPSLCRAILRVYLLGGGVCTSLEDVGKTLAAEVAAGKHAAPPSSPTAVGVEDGSSALAIAPLLVRVQALPKVMELQLIDEDYSFWDDNFPGLVRERQEGVFTHVLSVIFVRGAFLYGLAPASTHGRCLMENSNEDSAVCRAFYKIKEVTARAGICYDDKWTAIDMGSAPGGWTSFLSARCKRVLSVDPAELDPEVLALPNVVHVQQTIQAARSRLLYLLAGENMREKMAAGDREATPGNGANRASEPAERLPGSLEIPTARFPRDAAETAPAEAEGVSGADIVVSDMNAEPQVVTDLLLSCLAAGLAKPGALLVATFKDFCGQKRMVDEVAKAVSRLEAGTAADETRSHVMFDSVQEGGNGNGGLAIVATSKSLEAKCAVIGMGRDDAHLVTWRLERVRTLRLLSGGRAEQTIVARVARVAQATLPGVPVRP